MRADGSTADKCTGRSDAAYPGTGTNQACAWSSPLVALPPGGSARIAGGDTLLIASGQYKIGYGATGAPTNSTCHVGAPWDCVLLPVPSGPDAAHPTRIVGQGHDSGCSAPPQLWGSQGAAQVLSLAGSNNVQVSCLEITDRATCAQNHTGSLACSTGAVPRGDWAAIGVYGTESTNVQLTDIDVHGLASQGMLVGGVSNWTMTRVKIVGNGFVGWDGDLRGRAKPSSNSGTIKFSHVDIEWNGCVETYPGRTPSGCWGQSANGYGDGLGTYQTGGNWIFEDTVFKHNVSDGLDLLYADGTGSVTVNRVWSEGNASNQIKIAGPSSVTNLVAIGNCGYFDGKSFTYNVDPCRALGDTVVLKALAAGQKVSLVNSTVIGEGNVIVNLPGPSGSSAVVANNILVGWPYYYDNTTQAADVYIDGAISVSQSYTTKQNLRNASCSGTVVCGSAGLTSTSLSAPDVSLAGGSAARNSGLGVGGLSGAIPAVDYYGNTRPAGGGVDRGAIEAQ
ncbi:MAG: hypothetical protein EPO12_21490 [Aquabacterium sp.]|nr:MAG: hypothetical protein EPO12_21490 [Aquabacterium sp.]